MSDRKTRYEVIFRNGQDVEFESIAAASLLSASDWKLHAKF